MSIAKKQLNIAISKKKNADPNKTGGKMEDSKGPSMRGT
jgi:hypothetical protein